MSSSATGATCESQLRRLSMATSLLSATIRADREAAACASTDGSRQGFRVSQCRESLEEILLVLRSQPVARFSGVR